MIKKILQICKNNLEGIVYEDTEDLNDKAFKGKYEL